MVVRIDPVRGEVGGLVSLPCSKSVSARQILVGLHSGGPFVVEGLSEADDTQKLIQIVRACGYRVEADAPIWSFEPGRPALPTRLYAGEGGTTLRFILPWLAYLPGRAEVYAEGRLAERPLAPLLTALVEAGAQVEASGGVIRITGNPDWRPRAFRVDASQSGQFLSALLLMAPHLEVGSEVREISGQPATLSYVENLTTAILKKSGYQWDRVGLGHWILAEKGATINGASRHVGEADWSGAGYFWGWAMGVAARLEMLLDRESEQPERAFWMEGSWPVQVEPQGASLWLLSGGEIPTGWEGDIEAVPDTFPTLAVLAALSRSPWIIRGTHTLPYKESHRLMAMQAELSKVGAHIEWQEHRCYIRPPEKLPGEPLHLHSHGDHRIAMALSLLASRSAAPIYIHQAEVVQKSFPDYWEVLQRLGIPLTFES